MSRSGLGIAGTLLVIAVAAAGCAALAWMLSAKSTAGSDAPAVGLAQRSAQIAASASSPKPTGAPAIARPSTGPATAAINPKDRFWEVQPLTPPSGPEHVPSAWRIVGISGQGERLGVLVEVPGTEALSTIYPGARFPDGSTLVAVTARTATVRPFPGQSQPLIVLDL